MKKQKYLIDPLADKDVLGLPLKLNFDNTSHL